MALRADVDANLGLDGPRLKGLAAGAAHDTFPVLGMDTLFHFLTSMSSIGECQSAAAHSVACKPGNRTFAIIAEEKLLVNGIFEFWQYPEAGRKRRRRGEIL
jgi:hypothetical protein